MIICIESDLLNNHRVPYKVFNSFERYSSEFEGSANHNIPVNHESTFICEVNDIDASYSAVYEDFVFGNIHIVKRTVYYRQHVCSEPFLYYNLNDLLYDEGGSCECSISVGLLSYKYEQSTKLYKSEFIER